MSMLAKTKALILATVFMHPDISLILLGSSTEYSKNAKIQQNTPKYKKSEIQAYLIFVLFFTLADFKA